MEIEKNAAEVNDTSSLGLEAEQKIRQIRQQIQRRHIKLAVSAIIGIGFLSIFFFKLFMATRRTYPSAENMRKDLQGTYTYYDDSGTAVLLIDISNDTLTYRSINSGKESTYAIEKWDYQWGVIHAGDDIVVTLSGNLDDGGYRFLRGKPASGTTPAPEPTSTPKPSPTKPPFTNLYGTESTICAKPECNNVIAPSGDTAYCIQHSNKCAECGCYIDGDAFLCISCIFKFAASTSPSSTNYESGWDALSLNLETVSHNSLYNYCSGSVTNNGNSTYRFIEVKASFKDSNGNVVDTGWTYAVGSEGLAPGESSKFEIFVSRDNRIYSCSARILDFD